MGKALYRSYRSKSFDEIIGQDHITETLKNSLKNGTYAHAYLLTGPKGVGKTSVARILAHAVNKVKYPADVAYIDIIEIDAASNRRIDEIRELRERVNIAPTELKHKVYIIDEVHMLTKEAFNALLKTLEEPPEHVIFILATTDIHKVPDTIISRCLRFNFRPISEKNLTEHLKNIAKNEKIDIDEDALTQIAKVSSGSFRDAIALLDQLRGARSRITKEVVQVNIGFADQASVDDLLKAVVNGDMKQILLHLDATRDSGATYQHLTRQLLTELESELLSPSRGLNKTLTMQLIENLLNVETYNDTKTALELALLKTAIITTPMLTVEPASPPEPAAETTEPEPIEVAEIPAGSETLSEIDKNDDELWQKVLDILKQKNRGLYSVARMAEAEISDHELILKLKFAFHHKQLSQPKTLALLKDTVKAIEPRVSNIQLRQLPPEAAPATDNSAVKNISNIFGNSELLESE